MSKNKKETNSCKCCGKNISKNADVCICSDCKFDDDMTLSATNAKKLYGLTNDDLNNGDFFTFEVCVHKKYGTKYLVKELEEYSENKIEVDEKYASKMKRKKVLAENKELKENRKDEINEFIYRNLTNRSDPEIIKIQNDYVNSKIITIDDIKNNLLNKDKEISQLNKIKKTFSNNFKEIMRENLQEDSYVAKLLGLANTKETIFLIYNENYNLKFYTDEIINDFIYEITSNNFDCLITTKASILNSGYIKKIEESLKIRLLPVYERLAREHELKHKLLEKKLELRDDSKLCQLYINGGIQEVNDEIDIHIESVDDIVDVMEEMDFYFKHTQYSTVMQDKRNEIYNCRKMYGDYGYVSTSELSEMSKKIIVKSLSKDLLKIAPKRVVSLYDEVNQKKKKNKKYNY